MLSLCDADAEHLPKSRQPAITKQQAMKPSILLLALMLSAATAQQYALSPRPTLTPMPYNPRRPFPNPPPRSASKVCVVNTHGDGATDDSYSILFALHECNNGGHVLFLRDKTYIIATAMDWTFLNHVDIGMT